MTNRLPHIGVAPPGRLRAWRRGLWLALSLSLTWPLGPAGAAPAAAEAASASPPATAAPGVAALPASGALSTALEDDTPSTRAWVAARNAESEARWMQGPGFEALKAGFLQLGQGTRQDSYLNGGWVHRLQAEAGRPLGRWQVQAASPQARRILGPGWHTLLDLDDMARADGQRWKFPLWWKNPMCDATLGPRCIVNLSPDGGDRTVLREFDLRQRRFVPAAEGGFAIDTPARTYAHWISRDQLLLATDFGPGSLSGAQYARQARVWQRGTPHTAARPLFEAPEDSVLFIPHNFRHRGGTLFVAEVWRQGPGAPEWWLLQPDAADGQTARRWMPPVDLVRYRGLMGIVGDRLLAMSARPLDHAGGQWPAGSVLALPLPGAPDADKSPIEPVFVPDAHQAVDPVFHLAVARDALWMGLMNDVSAQLWRVRRTPSGQWPRRAFPLPPHSSVRLLAGEIAPSAVLVKTESLLSPPRSLLLDEAPQAPLQARSLAQAPNPLGAGYQSTQYFATSRDGTQVPYYVLRARGPAPAQRPPALLTAYGGFGFSYLPAFLNPEFHSDLALPLLRAGALHVHVNIRGGGEYGPAWHQAAQRRLRPKGQEDLIAVAEDLVRRGLADPKRLGFIGSSNGGLLAGAVATARPELWRAVVADVPILDMLRFHTLFTGAVWIDEYGDPRDPQDRAVLAGYSPLHRLQAGVRYPALLLTTATSDDRVHPGHARRFAERLRELGQPVWFHESADAGHGGAGSLASAAATRALQANFLLQQLTAPPP